MIDRLYKIAKHPVVLITIGLGVIFVQAYLTN